MTTTAPASRPVAATRRPDLHGTLVETLGMSIVSGGTAPGERISPERLGADLGVSRTAIREAMRVLQDKRLFTTKPNAGTVIRPVEQWNLLDPDVLRWRAAAGRDEPIDAHLRQLAEQLRVLRPLLAGNPVYRQLMQTLTGQPLTDQDATGPALRTTVHAKRAPHWEIPRCDVARTGDLIALDRADTVTCPVCLALLAAEEQPQSAEPYATLAEGTA